jgi:tRNA A37 methylthiotransferase MiaB
MRGHVTEAVKKQRSARLIALSEDSEHRFAQRFTGHSLPVLWEQVAGATEAGFVNVGYTDNYIRVRCIHPRVLTNHVIPTRLVAYNDGVMQATPEFV